MLIDTLDDTMNKLKAINKAYYDRVRKIKELDQQGRHRSEWCYAPYDGRKTPPPKNGGQSDG